MKLAIRGDKKRGQEVIEILKALGARNEYGFSGGWEERYHYISDFNTICVFDTEAGAFFSGNYKLYTLDDFLKEFPYKIGDTVRVDSHISGDLTIMRMTWSEQQSTVLYGFFAPDKSNIEWVSIVDIKPINKQTTMNIAKILKDAPRGTKLYSPLYGEVILDCVDLDVMFKPIKLLTPQGECLSLTEYGRYTDNEEYVDAECILFPSKENRDWSTFKVEPQFPTKICDCGLTLGIIKLTEEYQYKRNELNALRQLLIARDAWWKMDGDWKPDWRNPNEEKSTIALVSNKICIGGNYNSHCILAFRTEEIRDKFLETFRNLIEECKELI